MQKIDKDDGRLQLWEGAILHVLIRVEGQKRNNNNKPERGGVQLGDQEVCHHNFRWYINFFFDFAPSHVKYN